MFLEFISVCWCGLDCHGIMKAHSLEVHEMYLGVGKLVGSKMVGLFVWRRQAFEYARQGW